MPEAAWFARQFPKARRSFRASNQFAQAIAARAGTGLALLPHYIARTEPGLRHWRPDLAPPPRELWLLTRRHDRKDLPIRTVVEHLTQVFTGAGPVRARRRLTGLAFLSEDEWASRTEHFHAGSQFVDTFECD